MNPRILTFGLCLFVAGLLCLNPPSRAQLMMMGIGGVAGGGGCTTTTWNPADKGANSAITLSGGNLTATAGVSPSNASNVRAIASHASTSSIYFASFTIGHTAGGGSVAVGIASDTFVVGNAAAGQWFGAGVGGSSFAYYDDGSIYSSAAVVATMASFTSGDVVDMWVNLVGSISSLAFRVNGGNWNNNGANTPTTGAVSFTADGGSSTIWFPAMQVNVVTENVTANFGCTAYPFTPPGGTNNW